MKVKLSIKRTVSFLLSVMICIGLVGSNLSGSTYADDTSEYEQKLNEIAEKQEELAEKIADMQGSITEETEKKKLVESQIETTSEKIELIDNHLSSLADEMSKLEKSISETSAQIELQKSEIESGISDFKQRLRALYLAGDSSYTSIILGSGDFFDMLMKVELVGRVASHDDKLIDELVEKKKDYEKTSGELNRQKSELEDRQKDYEKQKKTMTAEIEKLNELYESVSAELENLEAQKSKYVDQKSAYDAEQDAFERQLQAAIKANSQKVTTTTEPTTEPATAATTTTTTTTTTKTTTVPSKTVSSSSKTTSKKVTTAKKTTTTTKKITTTTKAPASSSFKWPCPGYYLITSGFGSRWGSFHYGIDVGNSGIRGADVVAAKSGTVIMANNSCTHDYGKDESCGCGWGWGNYCVIDHGDGYQTIYAHMSKCKVTVGQTVTQGQVLGNVGSTGWSTGDHLHFEVRIDGTAVDPMDFF